MNDENRTRDDIRGRRLEKLRFWRRACAEESETLKLYNAEMEGNPLIFLHGDFEMGGFYVRRLAAECGYPIAALASHGLEDPGLRPSIEWMAKERLRDILAFRPAGPYRLGGYCNGALVAYECARLLKEQGREVELILMIEPPSLNTWPFYRRLHGAIAATLATVERRSLAVQKSFGHLMNAFWNIGRTVRLPSGDIVRLARNLATHHLKHVAKTENLVGAEERRIRETNAALRSVYLAATASYLPPPTTTPIVVLSTGIDHGGRRCGLYDGTQWSRLASSFLHIQLSGHHLTCLSEHASELAANLARVLQGPLCVSSRIPAYNDRLKLAVAHRT
ncbi:peptide synthetase [Agrobacterium rhizogenes]|uniref:thioesterase domain-containing protein n=1 Tax=Rhizobium rhizogenes TaxID=359 RepID=UPI00157432C2|nr:thioesterase domain-containing protein [Rhizobium rhizogenes]NTG88762.1 peptide synthetase [Rhizobium rhizogenes]